MPNNTNSEVMIVPLIISNGQKIELLPYQIKANTIEKKNIKVLTKKTNKSKKRGIKEYLKYRWNNFFANHKNNKPKGRESYDNSLDTDNYWYWDCNGDY